MPHSQEPMSSALVSAKADLNHEVTITGIKVTYKAPRGKYPVSVQVMIGDKVTNESREYRKHQDVSWDLNKQFSSEEKLSIVVREHHRIKRRDRYFRTVVSVADMIMKPVLVINEPAWESMSMSIYCETGGPFVEVIRKLIEEAQGRLSSMKIFMEKLGKVCEALNIIVGVAEPLGDAHPAVKAAVKVATLLYERCNTLQECHAAATELMEGIASFLPFTEIPFERCKSSVTIQTAESLLESFEQISRAIIDSSTDTILGFLLKDQLDEVNGYKEKFKRLKETFDWCVKTEIWKTVLRIETHTSNLLLARLRPVDSVFYANEKSCFEGTRKDTLEIIERWSSSDSNILWLHGFEGCGKSTIAHTVAQLFDEQNRLAGCFFFDGCRERRDLEAIIPSIAHQFSKVHQPYSSFILKLLEGHEGRNIHTSLSSQFRLLMEEPLIELSKPSMAIHNPPTHLPWIIVLDALEQCSIFKHSRRFLAGYIRRIAELVPWLKVFVSSRKLSEFGILSGSDCQEIDISNPLVDCESDIAAYAKYQANREMLPMERMLSQDYKLPGMLSRVRVLTQTLGALKIGEGVEAGGISVEKLGMDGLSHLLILAIMSRPRYAENMVPIRRNILAVVAFVTTIGGKPPTRDMLLLLLKPFWPAVTLDALLEFLCSLCPILSIDGSEVELLFPAGPCLGLLSDKQRFGAFAIDIDIIGNEVARRCLDEMDAHLRFIICKLDPSYLLNNDTEYRADRIKSRIPEMLSYSCLSWMEFVIKSGNAHAFSKTVFDFLCSPNILVWIEVLSLTGSLEMSKEILLKCINFFKGHNDVCEAARELHVFISRHYTAIELSTSRVYVPALAWLPGGSTTSSRILRFISSRPKIVFESSATKSTTERRLESDWDLVYSTDGNRIVSKHEDGTLNIWDGRTGVLIHGPLSGHSDRVWSVAFSRDGSRIVSRSLDELRIWDALSGKLVAGPFKKESNAGSVETSPDESRIDSGDIIVKSIQRYRSPVTYLAYSPDGNRIVTASFDMLRIWDANTAESIGNPLTGHSDNVVALEYSPDGSRIVSASQDETVRVWDAHTGKQLGEPLEGHTSCFQDVGYSRDGSRLLLSSVDEIRIWDAHSIVPIGVVHRGESRWDTDKQCFLSIPSWWPRQRLPKVQSLLLSANPLYIPDDDGWIRALDGALLLWVPPEHSGCTCHRTQDSTVTKDEHDERILNSEWRKLFHGKDWEKIATVEGMEVE